MNMEADARTAATKTLQAYINAINSKKGEAVSAAQAVANATSEALKSATASPSLPSTPTVKVPKKLPGHASGTTDSEKLYIAGEDGPELIVSGGGDTVFPTSETDKIISAIGNSDKKDNIQITAPVETQQNRMVVEESGVSNGNNDRTITLKIEGSGSIAVGANTSKEEVWGNAKDKIKSAFMSLLKEEVYEEGAGAYEF